MKAFNPIKRENVAPVDIDTFGNTYRELEQGHQKAVQFESALKTAMAQIDLNEAEDGWREQKINNIRATLSENTKYGNAAGAMDDLVRAQGNIFSDPALLGRVRNQQEYKKYLDNLNKRTDISEDYKNYYRANTKYHHEDIVNPETGKVIGSSKWEPNERPVSQIDLNDIFTTALKYVSPDSGSYDNITFLDPETNKTSKTYTSGAQLVRLNTVTNSYEKLGKDKLQAAVNAAMNANPAIKASLEQDFKIDKWKYTQNPDIFTDAYNNKGVLKTFDAYVQDKIDPFLQAKQYNRFVSKNDYNDSLLNQLWTINAKAKANAESKMPSNTVSPTTDTTGPLVKIDSTPSPETLNRYKAAFAKFNEVVNDKYKDLNFFVHPNTSLDDVTNLLNKTDLSEFEKDDILKSYSAVLDATAADRLTLKQMTENTSPATKASFNFLQELESANITPLNENDDSAMAAIKRTNAYITNNVFGDGGYVGAEFSSERMYNAFVAKFGGEEKLAKYGIERSNYPNGNIIATLPKEYADALSNFMIAAGDAYDERSSFGRGWDAITNRLGATPSTRFVRISEDKSQSTDLTYDKVNWRNTMLSVSNIPETIGTDLAQSIKQFGSNLTMSDWAYIFRQQKNKLSKEAEPIYKNHEKYVPMSINLGVNPRDWELRQHRSGATNSTEYTYYDHLSKDEANKYITHLSNTPGVLNNKQIFISELDDKGVPTGVYKVPTAEELQWLSSAISGIGDYKIDADKQVHIKTIRGNHPLLTLRLDDSKAASERRATGFTKGSDNYTKAKSNIGFTIIDGIDDPSFNAYNNSLESFAVEKAEKLIYNDVAFNVPILGSNYVLGVDPNNKDSYALFSGSDIETPVSTKLSYDFVNKSAIFSTFDSAVKRGLLRTEQEQLQAVAAYKELLDSFGMSENMRNNYINQYINQYFSDNETAQ